uniref:universal stress protein n=1 Tax=Pseudomonas laurentiana TaxID=2364649 RepID=UPI00389A83DC
MHITLFIEDVDVLGLMSGGEAARRQLQDEHRKWLADEADVMRRNGTDVTSEVVLTRTVFEDILEHVKQLKPDLVIKDVHHESLLKRVFITPLDWHLLRECPAAVHFVSQLQCPLPRVVVAAVDLTPQHPQASNANDCIMATATRLAEQCDAELHVLHAYDTAHTHITDAGAGTVTMPGFNREVRKSIEHAFAQLAERFEIPPERQHLLAGFPIKAIAEFAEQHRADVIVMGNTHHTGLDKRVGSTTEHVLYQVPCNVLATQEKLEP